MTFAEWRKRHRPELRREAPVGLVTCTSCRRVYTCLCGARETCSSKWPVTQRVYKFVATHNRTCWPRGVQRER